MNHKIDNFTLIVGAMKCGTTSLFNYLAEHPQIAPCQSKEPNFFTHEKSWRKGFSYYQTLWDFDPKIHVTALEASINYSKIPRLSNAAERIKQTAIENNVNFKIIYLMRNPIERIISHCTHDLEEQWSVRYNQPIVHGIPYPAIEISKYAMQISEYYQRFQSDDILLLSADELNFQPHSTLKKISKFINLTVDYNFDLSKKYNISLNKKNTNKAWPTFNKYIASPVISYLPRSKRIPVSNFVRGWFATEKVQAKFELSDVQYSFILKELESDLKCLKSQYGVNIAQWGLDI